MESEYWKAVKEGDARKLRILLSKPSDADKLTKLRDSKNGKTALHLAASNGDTEIINILIDAGHKTVIRDNKEVTPLHDAVTHGHYDAGECLITRMKEKWGYSCIDTADQDGNSALAIAADKNRPLLAALLIECHADVNKLNKMGEYPLTKAAIQGNTGVAKIILRQANLDQTDKNGITPLMHALRNGHSKFAQLLFTAKEDETPDVKAKDVNGRTPLHHTAMGGHIPELEFILEKGCSLEDTDKYGNTALLLATKFGRIAVMRILLSVGASKNAVNNKKKTILMLAAESGIFAGVKLILEPPLMNKRDKNGETALFPAAVLGHLKILIFLVRKGAATKVKNFKSETLLMKAIHGNNRRMAEYLIVKGCSIIDTDKKGNTALIRAINGELLEMLKFLAKQEFWENVVNLPNKKRETPLITAIRKFNDYELNRDEGDTRDRNFKTIKFLIDHGADINYNVTKHETPLMVAVCSGREELVKFLVNRGAKVNTTNKMNVNAFMLACSLGFQDVAQFLYHTSRREGEDIFVCSSDSKGNNPLQHAARNVQHDIVRWLLEDVYPDLKVEMINKQNRERETALTMAADYNNSIYSNKNKIMATIDCLLKHGANIDQEDINGNSAIINAVRNENIELVEFLLKKGATVNGKCFALASVLGNLPAQEEFERRIKEKYSNFSLRGVKKSSHQKV